MANVSSNKPGVYEAVKKDGTIYYRASFTYKTKHISLGSFDTADTANKAYNEAHMLINSSLTLMEYNNNYILDFKKWVVIINFRDNGLYIKTPIYLRNKMFYYYLSKSEYYIFDVDDLFYYSTHSIMKRGGHLFVADFGMQVNIASRYGIKNHAVCGKDYYFVNGNDHDYRYSNIVIINKYNGVTFIESEQKKYLSKIHVNGDFIIGRYNTETEAAIAYNKAIDIMASNNININYTKNYIDDISRAKYEEIHKNLEISHKIYNLRI